MQEDEIFEEDEEPFIHHPYYRDLDEKSKKGKKKDNKDKKIITKKEVKYSENDITNQKEIKKEYILSFIKWSLIMVIMIIMLIGLKNQYEISSLIYPVVFSFVILVTKVIIFLVYTKKMKNGTFKKSYYDLPPLFSDKVRTIIYGVIILITLGFSIYSFVMFGKYGSIKATVSAINQSDEGINYVYEYKLDGYDVNFRFNDKSKYYEESTLPYEYGDEVYLLYEKGSPTKAKLQNSFYINLRSLDYALLIYASFGFYISFVKYKEFKKKDLDLMEDLL